MLGLINEQQLQKYGNELFAEVDKQETMLANRITAVENKLKDEKEAVDLSMIYAEFDEMSHRIDDNKRILVKVIELFEKFAIEKKLIEQKKPEEQVLDIKAELAGDGKEVQVVEKSKAVSADDEAWCLKCHDFRKIKDMTIRETRAGPMHEGTCVNCGMSLHRKIKKTK